MGGSFAALSNDLGSMHYNPAGLALIVFLLASVMLFSHALRREAGLLLGEIVSKIALGLLFREWDHLRSESQLDSLLSREAAFLLNNLLFMGIFFVVFWGVFYPLISELLTGQKVTVAAAYYDTATGPLFAGLASQVAAAPL